MRMMQQAQQRLGLPARQPNQPFLPSLMPSMMPNLGKRMPEPTEVPAWLKALGLSRLDWFRIKGRAKSEAGSVDLGQAPAEYRELVKEYFEAIAREGEAAGDKN